MELPTTNSKSERFGDTYEEMLQIAAHWKQKFDESQVFLTGQTPIALFKREDLEYVYVLKSKRFRSLVTDAFLCYKNANTTKKYLKMDLVSIFSHFIGILGLFTNNEILQEISKEMLTKHTPESCSSFLTIIKRCEPKLNDWELIVKQFEDSGKYPHTHKSDYWYALTYPEISDDLRFVFTKSQADYWSLELDHKMTINVGGVLGITQFRDSFIKEWELLETEYEAKIVFSLLSYEEHAPMILVEESGK